MKPKQSVSPKTGQIDTIYRFIPQAKKSELLRLIIQDQFTIKQAAKKLGLNYSTAKYTVKQSKKLGKIKKVSCFKYGDALQNSRIQAFSLSNYEKNPFIQQITTQQVQANYPFASRALALQSQVSQNIAGVQSQIQNYQSRMKNQNNSFSKSQKYLILQEVNKQIHSTQQAIQRTFLLNYFIKTQQSPMILSLFQELQKQLISIAQNQMAMFTIIGLNIFQSSIQQPVYNLLSHEADASNKKYVQNILRSNNYCIKPTATSNAATAAPINARALKQQANNSKLALTSEIHLQTSANIIVNENQSIKKEYYPTSSVQTSQQLM